MDPKVNSATGNGRQAGRKADEALAALGADAAFDVVVLGSGAAGLAASVFAALEGRSVLLVERTEFLGGTSALSAATTWIPGTRHAAAVNPDDSIDNARAFLDRAVGNRSSAALREAFLSHGAAAIDRLEEHTEARFRPRPFHPDYLHELEGSTSAGRALEPYPYAAHGLGEALALIRPPIPEFTILGGMMIDRDDIAHLLRMGKSLTSLAYAVRRIGAYQVQKLRYGRGTRLVMGNALIARLLASALKLGVTIATKTETIAFEMDGREVRGLTLRQGAATRAVGARGGVILATGGFARHSQMRAALLPKPTPEHSPSAPGHTGAVHDLVLALGGRYGTTGDQPCFWAPVSVRRRADGTTAVFPHFVLDRSKPGTFCVGRDGRRFMNETRSYHEFGATQFALNRDGSHIPAFLVCDADALRRYGLGMVRPGGKGLKPYLDDGYLVSAPTLGELAAQLGIDGANLEATAAAMNGFAQTGTDTAFGRGSTVYERANGDASFTPNPTLGPVRTAPFYAVRLFPADIGAATGFVTDPQARILDAGDTPIGGLYAIGNDMQSIMGGVYPGPGITIGPGIVFGFIAARHAAARAAA